MFFWSFVFCWVMMEAKMLIGRGAELLCAGRVAESGEAPDLCQLPGWFARTVFVQAAPIGRQEGCVPTACALGSWGSTRQGCSGIL